MHPRRPSAHPVRRRLRPLISATTTVTTVLALLTVGGLSSLESGEVDRTPRDTVLAGTADVTPQVQERPIPAGDDALPASARVLEGDGADHEGDAPVGGGQVLASLAVPATGEFSMLGVTWDDPLAGEDLVVEVRTRGADGWSEWQEMHIEATPAPDEGPAVRGGTEPLWVGPSLGAQVRVGGPGRAAPPGLELSLIDPGEGPPGIALRSAGTASMPPVITRGQWGADESLRSSCSSPRYGETVRGITVHHTVNSNDYTRAQAWSIVRGIYAYHTRSQGWCDLGYNFLVDKFGRVFEGRAGGITRQVRGAHSGDFSVNELATGVSLIGNFETTPPTAAMKQALVDLTAWRLGAFYRDPSGTTSIGGRTYRTVMGHRDVKATACPGRYAYAWLPTLRSLASAARGDWRTPIYRQWQRRGGESGWLGAPRVGEEPVGDGRVTRFRRADLFQVPGVGVRLVQGPIRTRFNRLGGPASALGFPTTHQRRGAVPGLTYNRFQGGAIFRHPDTGTRVTYGPVWTKYDRLGAASSPYGLLTSDVHGGTAGVAGAASQNLQRGRIYHHPRLGTHVTQGAVAGVFFRRGGAAGFHGFPRSDARSGVAGDPRGMVQSFQRGRIYYHPATGAKEVHGRIAKVYARHRGASGPLGFPTTHVRSISVGLRSDFQGGRIVWRRKTGRTNVVYY